MLIILITSILISGEAHHGYHTTSSPAASARGPPLDDHAPAGEDGRPGLALRKGKGHENETQDDSDKRMENLHENVSEITHYTNLASSGVICSGSSVGRTDLFLESSASQLSDIATSTTEENGLNYLRFIRLQEITKNNVTSTTDSLHEETLAQKGCIDAEEQSLNVPRKPRKPKQVRKSQRRSSDVKIFVDGGQTTGGLRHFWRSTGLCPPSPHTAARPFLLSQDEKLNLALIGSLPHDAISQVRIHWLLDLVNGSIENGRPQYNFTQLDVLMDLLHQHQLRPGFELMGNPGSIFDDLENNTQVLWWRGLVAHTAGRYVDRYGLEWVASWRWETWNEPDHHDFDNLVFTVQGFLNYYDSSRAGLDDVSVRLVLGGPGGSCREPRFSRLCWALLRHCDRGSSFFTPGLPPRIDFISFHKKGHEDADSILTQELLTLHVIHSNFPNLRHVPVVNDEGDFLKGWWRGLAWRADDRYAALVARAVYIHLFARAALPQYELISFDNAFLNYRPSFFDQRTLLARFQINSTTPRQVQLVKKAAYTVMAMMSLLGDRSLPHVVQGSDNRLSIISSCRNCQWEPVKTSVRRYSRHEELQMSENSNPCSRKVGSTCSSGSPADEGTKGKTFVDRTDQQQHRHVNDTTTPHEYLGARGPGTKNQMNHNNTPDKGELETRLRQLWEATDLPSASAINNKTSESRTMELDARGSNLNETMNREKKAQETVEENVRTDNTTDNMNSRFINSVNSGEAERRSGMSNGSWEATVLVSLSNGPEKSTCGRVTVGVMVALPRFLLGGVVSAATYRLGAGQAGPYEAWLNLGRPVEPTRAQLTFIRSFESPRRTGPQMIVTLKPNLCFWMKLYVPDVRVIHLCQTSTSNPGQVTGVKTVGVTTADVLVTWSDAGITTRCVLRYEVEHSVAGRGGPYARVSGDRVTHNNFWYSLPALRGPRTVQGWYRVRVVTYWGTTGAFSPPAYHHVE